MRKTHSNHTSLDRISDWICIVPHSEYKANDELLEHAKNLVKSPQDVVVAGGKSAGEVQSRQVNPFATAVMMHPETFERLAPLINFELDSKERVLTDAGLMSEIQLLLIESGLTLQHLQAEIPTPNISVELMLRDTLALGMAHLDSDALGKLLAVIEQGWFSQIFRQHNLDSNSLDLQKNPDDTSLTLLWPDEAYTSIATHRQLLHYLPRMQTKRHLLQRVNRCSKPHLQFALKPVIEACFSRCLAADDIQKWERLFGSLVTSCPTIKLHLVSGTDNPTPPQAVINYLQENNIALETIMAPLSDTADVVYVRFDDVNQAPRNLEDILDSEAAIVADFSRLDSRTLLEFSAANKTALAHTAERADLFISSRENYSFIFGMLASATRLNHLNYDEDNSLKFLIYDAQDTSSLQDYLAMPLRAADKPVVNNVDFFDDLAAVLPTRKNRQTTRKARAAKHRRDTLRRQTGQFYLDVSGM